MQRPPPRSRLTVLVEDLGTSLEPNGLLEADTVLCQQLREDASQSSQHSPPGVDDLDLPAREASVISLSKTGSKSGRMRVQQQSIGSDDINRAAAVASKAQFDCKASKAHL